MRREGPIDFYDPIGVLGLSPRTETYLRKSGINVVGWLWYIRPVWQVQGIGDKSEAEIRESVLHRYGVHLEHVKLTECCKEEPSY